jgi:hypothetical protein
LQQTHDFRRLVSCNSAGHAQSDFHRRKVAAFPSRLSRVY